MRPLITGGKGPDAEKWSAGMVVNGRFMSAIRPPNAKSFLYSFVTLAGKERVVWGNVVLDRALAQVSTGEYVVLKCFGKATAGKSKQEYWDFRAASLTDAEAADFEGGRLALEKAIPPLEPEKKV